jgi:hypothetical protein
MVMDFDRLLSTAVDGLNLPIFVPPSKLFGQVLLVEYCFRYKDGSMIGVRMLIKVNKLESYLILAYWDDGSLTGCWDPRNWGWDHFCDFIADMFGLDVEEFGEGADDPDDYLEAHGVLMEEWCNRFAGYTDKDRTHFRDSRWGEEFKEVAATIECLWLKANGDTAIAKVTDEANDQLISWLETSLKNGTLVKW